MRFILVSFFSREKKGGETHLKHSILPVKVAVFLRLQFGSRERVAIEMFLNGSLRARNAVKKKTEKSPSIELAFTLGVTKKFALRTIFPDATSQFLYESLTLAMTPEPHAKSPCGFCTGRPVWALRGVNGTPFGSRKKLNRRGANALGRKKELSLIDSRGRFPLILRECA